MRARNNVEGLPSLSLKTLHLSTHLKLSFSDWEECGSFKVYVGLFAATCAWVRNYFRPYLSISACAIEVQHSNENSTTVATAITIIATTLTIDVAVVVIVI